MRLTPLETQIQQAAVQLFRILASSDERYANIYAVPNGAYSSKQNKLKMKAEGLELGVPDLVVDIPAHGYHGLRIEVKTLTGKISDEQRDWKRRLELYGYCHAYCYSEPDITNLVKSYFANEVFECFSLDLYRYGSERNRSGQIIHQSSNLPSRISRTKLR